MISGVWRIAAFAVFALLAAGCTNGGNDPHSTFTPTSTYTPPSYSTTPGSPPAATSPSVATTGPNVRPGEKPPVLPAVGKKNTPAGARAFAVFYVQALDWGYATMDSTLAKSLYAKSCNGCERFMRVIFDSQRAKGRHYEGSRLTATGAQSMPNDHHFGAAALVDVMIFQAKGALTDARGHLVEKEPVVRHATFRGWLGWRARHWAIVDWKLEVRR
jgi:hypothetical protein